MADFLVITANGPHLFLPEIEQAAGCRVLSMVEATLKEVYTRPFGQLGIVWLLRDTADEADLINPAQLLAEAAVRVALREPEWIS